MPYINAESRAGVDASGALTCGELNYAFTRVIELYRAKRGNSYQTFNDIMGALEGAKLEFYRRVVALYEEDKKFANGDVYVV